MLQLLQKITKLTVLQRFAAARQHQTDKLDSLETSLTLSYASLDLHHFWQDLNEILISIVTNCANLLLWSH